MTTKDAIIYLRSQQDCICSEDCKVLTNYKDCPQESVCNDVEALNMAIEAMREKEKLEKYPLSPLLEELYKEDES